MHTNIHNLCLLSLNQVQATFKKPTGLKYLERILNYTNKFLEKMTNTPINFVSAAKIFKVRAPLNSQREVVQVKRQSHKKKVCFYISKRGRYMEFGLL